MKVKLANKEKIRRLVECHHLVLHLHTPRFRRPGGLGELFCTVDVLPSDEPRSRGCGMVRGFFSNVKGPCLLSEEPDQEPVSS